jgi:serine/threonine-protein kinase
MTDDPRVQQLLDEMLASDAAPEAVCVACPELLPLVRKRLRRIHRVQADLDVLFPPRDEGATFLEGAELPEVPGYELEAVIGRGGMGVVFRARHLRLNRPVALKMALGGAYAEPRERVRFQREAEAVAALRHPNIVQVYDVGESDGQTYFTMEYMDEGSLATKLAGTPQIPQQGAQLLVTLAEAVQAAHVNGIVHCDLKPSNVLLTADGVPKISDFGLARQLAGEGGITRTDVPVGTPSYMAPEQALGRPDALKPAVDVYALGAILYELLTGRPPFRAASAACTVQQVISQEPAPPSRLNDKVPRDLETICLKCLTKEPLRRYGTAAELAEDLRRYIRGEPILARRAGPIERLAKWTRRHRSLAAALFSGMLLLNVLVAMVVSALADRRVLTRTVEADFREVTDAQQRQAWDDGRKALERANGRLGGGGPPELRRRADQLERELALVATLQRIHQGRYDPDSDVATIALAAAAFEATFRKAGLMDRQEDVKLVASRIRATGIAPALLVALDEWAWLDENHRDWLFEIARQVEPNPTSRQVRDPKLWNNLHALEEFTRSMPIETQSVPFLLLVGQRIHDLRGDAIVFLKRVQRAHPTNFELNLNLGLLLLRHAKNSAEAIGYLQAAVALGPASFQARRYLVTALTDVGRVEAALEECKAALRLAPKSGYCHFYTGLTLCELGRFDEAMPEMRRACELEPRNAVYLSGVGICFSGKNKHAEAIEVQRAAIALDPNCWAAQQRLAIDFLALHQMQKAHSAWQEALALGPGNLEHWDGYAELSLFLRDEAEYRRVRKELLNHFRIMNPREAERVGRACLLLPAAEDELRQATDLIDRALASERAKPSWLLPYFRFAKALAEYRTGRFESARALLDGDTQRVLGPAPCLLLAMVQHRLGKTNAARESLRAAIAAFDWDEKKATDREVWMYHLLRREAEASLAEKP